MPSFLSRLGLILEVNFLRHLIPIFQSDAGKEKYRSWKPLQLKKFVKNEIITIHFAEALTMVRCGECIGCFQSENCGKCDGCSSSSSCFRRKCVQESILIQRNRGLWPGSCRVVGCENISLGLQSTFRTMKGHNIVGSNGNIVLIAWLWYKASPTEFANGISLAKIDAWMHVARVASIPRPT